MPEPHHHAQTIKHFGRMAAHYDHRHQRYIQQTLSWAVEALRLPSEGCLLDVGCGTGELMRLVQQRYPQAALVGVDVTPEMLAVAREKFRQTPHVSVSFAEAETLPFAAERFDAVVSCNMLHHVRAVDRFIGECARVLRPQGQFVLVDWSRDYWHCRLAHYWLRLVKRSYAAMYRSSELIRLAAPCGLLVEDVSRLFVAPYYGMMRLTATKRRVA